MNKTFFDTGCGGVAVVEMESVWGGTSKTFPRPEMRVTAI